MSDPLPVRSLSQGMVLLGAWQKRFVNRPRPYALQEADGTYRWVYRTLTPERVLEHLWGERTLALSSTDAESRCRWVCLDVDTSSGLTQLVALRQALAALGLPGMVEASRRGGHLWLFFEELLPAADARTAILAALQAMEAGGDVSTPVPFELYPSAANTVAGTLGQAVRLSLGIHRQTGRRYPLLDAEGLPCVFTTLERAVRYVVEQPTVPTMVLASWSARLRPAHRPARWAATEGRSGASGLADAPAPTFRVGTHSVVIRWVDASVSPLDLLDELAPETAVHRVGQGYVGWCPFHDDRAPDELGQPGTPSFYVVHNTRYSWSWRCLSTNCAHSVGPMRHSFRLFQELLALDVQSAIQAALLRWPGAEAALARELAQERSVDDAAGHSPH
jgi:hypothetical protein